MPTYTCWSEPGVIAPEQRAAVATALTEIHHEVAVAPRYFVQVVFTELAAGALFLAGQPATTGHLWIRADIRAGRTDTQKRAMLERITTEVGAILSLPPEEVWVYLCDVPGAAIAEHGRALPEPGEEEAWFAALPEDLQRRLAPHR